MSPLLKDTEEMIDIWSDGWRDRTYSMIKRLGFESVTSFLDHEPDKSFEDKSTELGLGEIAPIQLQWLYRDEAKKNRQTKQYLAGSFVRYLARHIPNGIRLHGEWPLNLALGSWAGSMDEEDQDRCAIIVKRFKDASLKLPDDWIPKSDDPVVVKIFDVLEDAIQTKKE